MCVSGLGLRRWPELARGTVAYLSRENAVNRRCPGGQENFVFLKQGWWLEGSRPIRNPATGEVPVDSVTRMKPGFYTFNYAVYFSSTATYAWMNHRDYGFPLNWIKPQKAYLSRFPPPLEDTRTAANLLFNVQMTHEHESRTHPVVWETFETNLTAMSAAPLSQISCSRASARRAHAAHTAAAAAGDS